VDVEKIDYSLEVEVNKKTEKPIKPRKLEKNNWKNQIEKKNRLNFEKTEPKPKKPEKNRAKTRKNRAKTEKIEPKPEKLSQTSLNRFLP
jgi:hypothetical protein